jgi:hypothetical protein
MERIDRLARTLAATSVTRRTLPALIVALAAGRAASARAQTCAAIGDPCASEPDCCARLACDPARKICVGLDGAAGCTSSRVCAPPTICIAGVCQQAGAQVCRAITQSCNPIHAAGRCCAGLQCDRRSRSCRGLDGATGCNDDTQCARYRVCEAGTCRIPKRCQGMGDPCGSAADGATCCERLKCDKTTRTCLGLRNAAGCDSDARCTNGNVCCRGVCLPPALCR